MPTLFDSSRREKPVAKKEKQGVTAEVQRARIPMGPLTCFAVSPGGVRFETQERGEEVILFLRQHVIFLVPRAVLILTLLFAPSVLFPFFLKFSLLPVKLPSSYIVIGTLFWYVATFGLVLTGFLRWFFNIYIVTNHRVVDVDFINLLYKEFSEARLTKIQDVTYKSGGILSALFNYGNVYVQTAGGLPNFEFLGVPNPEKVVQAIGELAAQAGRQNSP